MRVKVRSISALSSTMRMLGWGTRDLFPVRWTPAQRWKKAQRRSDFGFSSGKRGWLAGVALRYLVISDEISRNKAIPAVSKRSRIATCGASAWPSVLFATDALQRYQG